MKKKELLSMPTLTATSKMVDVAKADEDKIVYERYRDFYGIERVFKKEKYEFELYFRVVVVKDILKIAVFTRKHLRRGIIQPKFEIYIDREAKKWLTYEPRKEKWLTAKINNLKYDQEGYSGVYATSDYQTQRSRDVVNQYFSTGKNLSVREAVLDFQSQCKDEEKKKKYRSEIEQIDAVMNEVPSLPKRFDDWVKRNCFQETLFYQSKRNGKAQVYCTHCGRWMEDSGRPAHGKDSVCPGCGIKGIYRSWNKQKTVRENVEVSILQRLEDGSGYILRKFRCYIKRQHERGWDAPDYSMYEYLREKINNEFKEEALFNYEEYRNTGVTRWCNHTYRYFDYYYCNSFGSAYMYTENLKRVLRHESMARLDLKKIFRGGERKSVEPVFILNRLNQYPFLEYLQKSGLTALVNEIMMNREEGDLFNKDGKRIHEVLKLNKQNFHRFCKWNGGSKLLRAFQYVQQYGETLSDENIQYILENSVDTRRLDEIMSRTLMTMTRTLNYMERQQVRTGWNFHTIMQYYSDYLDMASERGMDVADDIVCRQPRMLEYHNRYLEEKNREEAIKRDQDVNDRFQNIRKDHKRNLERFGWQNKEFIMLVPEEAADITREGRLQHHCVGASDGFLRKMDSRQTFILFLRRREQKNEPYYTIEADWMGKVLQFYAAYDRQPNKEKIQKILKQWTRTVLKREQKLQEEAVETPIVQQALIYA